VRQLVVFPGEVVEALGHDARRYLRGRAATQCVRLLDREAGRLLAGREVVLEQQLAIGHAIVLGSLRFRRDIRHLVGQHVAGASLTTMCWISACGSAALTRDQAIAMVSAGRAMSSEWRGGDGQAFGGAGGGGKCQYGGRQPQQAWNRMAHVSFIDRCGGAGRVSSLRRRSVNSLTVGRGPPYRAGPFLAQGYTQVN
jgi:hypothetical protein